MPGPLKSWGWELLLNGHPDRVYAKTLVLITKHGARVGYAGPHRYLLNKSHPSALEAPQILTQDLQKQRAHDRITKLDDVPEPPFISSPLGLVPKHDGGWRRIHDLSYPHGQSVNNSIPQEHGSLEYVTFDDGVNALLTQGPGATLIKRDLSDAFRHIPVAKLDYWLLGFYCDESFWIDRFLPFGLRTSPYIFDLFAKGLHWILAARLGWELVLHYLDDFFAVLAPGADTDLYCRQFDAVCDQLGLTVNHKKDIQGTSAEFLGIELDSLNMQARLPPDKLERGRNAVKTLLARLSFPHKELESLVGFLSFAAKVIAPGRAFLRRLFDALRRHTEFIHIDKHIKADLLWWQTFLGSWNGISLLRLTATRKAWHIWTDASGTIGMGGYILHDPPQLKEVEHVFASRFPSRMRGLDIQYKEMKAVLQAMQKWRNWLQATKLTLHCDNQAVVFGLRKSTIVGPAMAPLREIVLLMAQRDIAIIIKWVPTAQNTLADDLSRFKFVKIANKYPQLSYLLNHKP